MAGVGRRSEEFTPSAGCTSGAPRIDCENRIGSRSVVNVTSPVGIPQRAVRCVSSFSGIVRDDCWLRGVRGSNLLARPRAGVRHVEVEK